MISRVAAESIGTRIRKRRQALGFRSQQEFADRIGVHRTTVSDWENDRYFPGRFQGAVEAVLGIILDSEPPPARVLSAGMRREIAALLDDEEDRKFVIGLLEGTIARPRS